MTCKLKLDQALCLLYCAIAFLMHFFSDIDMELQKLLFIDGKWILDPNEPLFNVVLYKLPKTLTIVLGLGAFFLLILHKLRRRPLSALKVQALLTFLVSIILFPIFINLLKDIFRQPCPRDMQIFGGSYAGTLWDYFLSHGDIRCFPGAHATSGFSLLSMVYFWQTRKQKFIFLSILLPYATLVGSYQNFRGVHFFSDTLFTAASSWLFINLVHHLISKYGPFSASKALSSN